MLAPPGPPFQTKVTGRVRIGILCKIGHVEDFSFWPLRVCTDVDHGSLCGVGRRVLGECLRQAAIRKAHPRMNAGSSFHFFENAIIEASISRKRKIPPAMARVAAQKREANPMFVQPAFR